MILAVHTWIGGHVGIWMFACVLSCLKAIRTGVLNLINLYLKFFEIKKLHYKYCESTNV